MDAPAEPADRLFRPEQALRRDAADTENRLRRDEFDLPAQIRQAARRLLIARIAVVRRPALQDIAYVHIATPESRRAQHRIEQLPGAPDEGLPLAVFLGARRLADHHEPRRAVADAEYRLRPRLAQAAEPAAAHGCRERLPVRRLGTDRDRGRVRWRGRLARAAHVGVDAHRLEDRELARLHGFSRPQSSMSRRVGGAAA